MSNYYLQFKSILLKSIKINFRGRQFIRQLISVLFLGVFTIIITRFDANNLSVPLYLGISVTGYTRYVALSWVNQRQTRQKQLQKIMGVSQGVYVSSWLIYYIINGIYITGVMMVMIAAGVLTNKQFKIAQGYNGFHIALLYFLYTISTIGFVMVFSTFFEKAKTAAQAIAFIQLLSNFLYFLVFSDYYTESLPLLLLSSLFPQQAFNLGISKIAFLNSLVNIPQYSYAASVLCLLFDSCFYVILALYLDQVWPNQIGTNKHPLFFIRWLWNRNVDRIHSSEMLLEQSAESSAKYEQYIARTIKPLVKIEKLTKKFLNKIVIDHMTLNFYQKEIFCLLGHNGAGKSTTINLLTGMLQPTEGKISLMDLNYKDNLTEIRQNIGLCLQYNVLYDDLTVQQHLYFYSAIKGKTYDQATADVQRTIIKCALRDQKNKRAKNLSGGNKRKLCLANALVGGSKLIFLDQPSSGLDPNSRQSIWQIMKSLKQQNKCVILTTHHLEQAQQLSQRIGIMSEGKLVIVGDCNYIKQKFNVGYHLTVTFSGKDKEQSMKKCREIVKSQMKYSKEDDQTAANTQKFILSLKELDQYSSLFQKLQAQRVGQLSIKMSNLEDAFIKLGTQELLGDGPIPDIPDLQLPLVTCKYSFVRQFKAIFIKKAIITFKSLSALFSIALPVIFISAGVFVAAIAINGPDEVLKYVKRYVISYFMVWAFVFNTSAYCGSIVLQRQKKFKYLSNVMGLRKLPYWTANYAFDVLIFILPLIPFFILVLVLPQADFLRDILHYIVILLVLFCFSFIGYSYTFSFVFQKSNTAYRLFPFINLICFYILPQIPQFVDKQNLISQYVTPLLSPFIAFSNSFQTRQFLGDIDTSRIDIFMSRSLIFNYLALLAQGFVFCGLTLLLESIRFNLKDRQELDFLDIEERIDEEEVPLNRSNIGENKPIYINNLYKKYPNGYIAIRNNSFSVAQKEIFGLLGPNGAGKSTTFNIVTAALPKTHGTVKILNEEVNRGMMDIFQNVGVCPQYDALYQIMTTQQHMKYFARLKGLKQEQIDKILKFYYEILSLTNYVKVQAGKLSGGNKRKLCVSMAMLANPRIMFFDQPSAGVDPLSRRYLWKSLALSVRSLNTSMVLTTHSMNQAQSLCSKIGILIKGKFVALDSPKNLTFKYGKGFRVEVYAQIQKHEKIKEIVLEQIKEIKIEQIPLQSQGILFQIPNERFILSETYKIFHDILYLKNMIKKYTIRQSTLQEVFLHLSKMQPEVVEEQYKQPWQCCCWEWGVMGCQCLL